MSKESLEHLSSLMDGELSDEAGLFLARRLSSDDEMCDTWERYHLIRDCIRQPGSKHFVTGMSAKMNASMDVEQATPLRTWRDYSWLKPVSGLAIAASVALMAIVVTAPQQGQMTGADDTALSNPVNQPFVSPNTLPLAPLSQAASFAPAEHSESNRLNTYLLRHNQMARSAGRQGFVSFVSIVATPVTEDDEIPEVEPSPEVSESKQGVPEDK